jgi:uncharacterized membrane protein YhaH (DUF805 family)
MKKYFSFDGTASRSEYWGVYVLSLLIAVVAGFMFGFFLAIDAAFALVGVLGLIALVVGGLWLGLATGARRCREAGISPWWTAALLLPYIGFIVAIALGCISPSNDTQA